MIKNSSQGMNNSTKNGMNTQKQQTLQQFNSSGNINKSNSVKNALLETLGAPVGDFIVQNNPSKATNHSQHQFASQEYQLNSHSHYSHHNKPDMDSGNLSDQIALLYKNTNNHLINNNSSNNNAKPSSLGALSNA